MPTAVSRLAAGRPLNIAELEAYAEGMLIAAVDRATLRMCSMGRTFSMFRSYCF